MVAISPRSGWVVAAVVLLSVSACGNGGDDETPTSLPSSIQGPYLLLRAPGWTLTGGEAAAGMGELPLGGISTTGYEHRPSPDRSLNARVLLTNFSGTPNELARNLGSRPGPVDIKGQPGVAVEELSSAGGNLVASHVIWAVEGPLVVFTVFGFTAPEAVSLAQQVTPVTEAEWRTAVDQANAKDDGD